jgi:hypothetical protein
VTQLKKLPHEIIFISIFKANYLVTCGTHKPNFIFLINCLNVDISILRANRMSTHGTGKEGRPR